MAGIIKTSINLSEIPKEKIINGKKGKYLNLTVSINDKDDNYGNNVSAWIKQDQGEREKGVNKVYLGNGKVFWSDDQPSKPQPVEDTDDLPF
mgnify:CR=1 FL=1